MTGAISAERMISRMVDSVSMIAPPQPRRAAPFTRVTNQPNTLGASRMAMVIRNRL
jgi:hypothetical protein